MSPVVLLPLGKLLCDMHGNSMIGSDGLSEGRTKGRGPRMEAGEPLEGRLNGNDEVYQQTQKLLRCT